MQNENAFDANGVMRENSRLDILLKRDSYKYMRLHGTESSFIKLINVAMSKKDKNGKYQVVFYQSDGWGSLVFTTRRLTFSILSTRGSISNFLPVYNIWGTKLKARDYIKYSIPNFLLCGSQIKGDFNTGYFLGRSNCNFEWELKNENVKFDFNVYRGDLEKIKNINSILSKEPEHIISYMKFFYEDRELYPDFDFELEDNKEPNLNKKLTSEERKNLFRKLQDDYSYYDFYGESKSKEEIVSKNKSINLIENFQEKMEEKDSKTLIPNISQEIEKLASLKNKGLLTDEEFTAAKAKLLN